MASRVKEIRMTPDAGLHLETRAAGDSQERRIVGYAALFDSETSLAPGVREVIRAGAFTNTLKKNRDVRAFWNHDSNVVLGRTTAGTLVLEEDEKGLRAEITPPSWADGYMETVERGDVSQMSFAFRPVDDVWTQIDNKNMLREIKEVQLFEVSPVAFPAYPKTSAKVRSLFDDYGIDGELLERALEGQAPEIISALQAVRLALRTDEATIRPTLDVEAGADSKEAQRRALYRQRLMFLEEVEAQ